MSVEGRRYVWIDRPALVAGDGPAIVVSDWPGHEVHRTDRLELGDGIAVVQKPQGFKHPSGAKVWIEITDDACARLGLPT